MDNTLIAVIEMSQSSWLVGGIVPGDRAPAAEEARDGRARAARLLHRWRRRGREARRTDHTHRGCLRGRPRRLLAGALAAAQGIEAHVIHASSVAVSREHRRAKTDRLDTELLKRAFLGWLRGERDHCKMVAVPTLAEEDAKRPSRERENLVGEQTRHRQPA